MVYAVISQIENLLMTNKEMYSLYSEHEELLNKIAYKLTQNHQQVPELCQDVLCKILTNKDKFKEGTNFKAWVRVIIYNTFVNKYRRKKIENTRSVANDDIALQHSSESVVNTGDQNLMVEEILKLIETLPKKELAIFKMYTQGYKYHEIAEELNFPLGTVKNLIYIARNKLIEDLKDTYPELMRPKRQKKNILNLDEVECTM